VLLLLLLLLLHMWRTGLKDSVHPIWVYPVNTLHRHTDTQTHRHIHTHMTTYTTAQYIATVNRQAVRIEELEDQVSALRRELANAEETEPVIEPVAEPAPVAEDIPRFIVGGIYSITKSYENMYGINYVRDHFKVVKRTPCFITVIQVNQQGVHYLGGVKRLMIQTEHVGVKLRHEETVTPVSSGRVVQHLRADAPYTMGKPPQTPDTWAVPYAKTHPKYCTPPPGYFNPPTTKPRARTTRKAGRRRGR